jgi:ubiquinone/menaquinone biosynthesis C-methylase UbiE
MQKPTNFDVIAPYYDGLSQLVFGRKIKKSQIEALKFIQPCSTILILGGGTGWILEELSKIHPSGLTITYVDISLKMIHLSKRRKTLLNTVDFINDSIQNISLENDHYDAVISPFFLDCFSGATVQSVFYKINTSLKINGLWLNIDFCLTEKSNFWQKTLIRLMYTFFRFICNIEATKLPHIAIYFTNYILREQKMFCNNFIIMQALQKKAP